MRSRPRTTNDRSFMTIISRSSISGRRCTRGIHPSPPISKLKVAFIGKPGSSHEPEELKSLEARWKEQLQVLPKDPKPMPIKFYPREQSKNSFELLYKALKTDSKLVKDILESAGFRPTDSHDWNLMWLSSSAKPYLYDGLSDSQRINHFPNSFEITRKDRLCLSIMNMQKSHGFLDFDFIPETFLLPEEFDACCDAFSEQSLWIVKPTCSSRGRGIYLIDSVKDIPDENCVVSKYIQNPFCINGLKFDLRIYVVVTSFEPLVVYVYNEGLVRFASEVYNPKTKNNRFVHLTNYSVNKRNDKFVQNSDWRKDDVGHKWSLKALQRHLEASGVDTDSLWNRIYDLIIKTLLSMEHTVVDSVRRLALHRNTCFELLGFDILIDSALKPWLIEVNLSPSLATDSPLDLHIKSKLVSDTFNLTGIRPHNPRNDYMNKVRNRIRAKQGQLSISREEGAIDLNSNKFKDLLRDILEEYDRKGGFMRIYPSKGTNFYDRYFKAPRPINKALHQALFEEIPLPVPRQPTPKRPLTTYHLTDSWKAPRGMRHNTRAEQRQPVKEKPAIEEEGKITDLDIKGEYLRRLISALKKLKEENMRPKWEEAIYNFIGEKKDESLYEQLETHLTNVECSKLDAMKQVKIKAMPASQLEEVIKRSENSLLRCFIDPQGIGVLSSMIKCLATSNLYGLQKRSFLPDIKSNV